MNQIMVFEVKRRLSNLLEIVEAQTDNARGAVWWGPVTGADGQNGNDRAPQVDLVSDGFKRVPMTVCEDN